MAGVTPVKCYCGAERVWVYEGRIAFKCGTVVSLPLHGDRWRVRRTQGCIESELLLKALGDFKDERQKYFDANPVKGLR